MRTVLQSLMLVAGIMLCVSSALAQELTQMEPERAQQVAELLVPKAAEVKSPQIEIKSDVSGAVGLRFRQDGILVVPQKGLSEEGEHPEVKTEPGAPLGYLFMTTSFRPVVKGKPVEPDKLRVVKVVDRQGNERSVICLLLAVRQLGDDDWRLYVYGPEKSPLVDAPFSLAEQEQTGPIALEIRDVQGTEGALVVTVFGKYEASFRIDYQAN